MDRIIEMERRPTIVMVDGLGMGMESVRDLQTHYIINSQTAAVRFQL